MDNLGWPHGLIQYTSENTQHGKQTRFLKPKTIGYGIVLLAAITALTWSIAHQVAFNATIEQIRQPLFVVMSDGRIQNTYEIKLNNRTEQPATFHIDLDDLPGAELDLGELDTVTLDPEQPLRVLARVRVPQEARSGQQDFTFVITPVQGIDAESVRRPAVFYLPE
jgi:polyferredoxin